MTEKAKHIAWTADTIAYYQRSCGSQDKHAIADLICDLGHLAEQRGLDFLEEVRRGVRHWDSERKSDTGVPPETEADVKITIGPARQSAHRVT